MLQEFLGQVRREMQHVVEAQRVAIQQAAEMQRQALHANEQHRSASKESAQPTQASPRRSAVVAPQEPPSMSLAQPMAEHEWTTRHYKSYYGGNSVMEAEQDPSTRLLEENPERVAYQSETYQPLAARGHHLPGAGSSSGEHILKRGAKRYAQNIRALGLKPRCLSLSRVVSSPLFGYMIGLCVVFNAILLGIETDFTARHPGEPLPAYLGHLDLVFCLVFLAEVIARIAVNPCVFTDHTADTFGWNMFDLMVVGLQCYDQLKIIPGSSVGHVQIFRTMRLFRVLRLLRVVRLFEELRVMTSSVVGAMESLAWAMVLLGVLLYICGVAFCQGVADAGSGLPSAQKLKYWFGTVDRSILTMFESITGGNSWDDIVTPLMKEVSPVLGLAYVAYMAICLFAILNTVTGVIVEKVTADARNNQALNLASQLRELFFKDGFEEIDLEQFTSRVHEKEFEDYLKGVDVDVSEAQWLFRLLDIDGSGKVSPEEVVNGCLRLGRPAHALELALLMRQVNDLRGSVLQPQ